MHRILFAWELGANFGHLTRDLPVANALRARGHEVAFCVKDVHVAQQVLATEGFRFMQAPLAPGAATTSQTQANYAEMLMALGYSSSALLAGLVNGWLTVFGLFKPDVVVINHAPTALLAARAVGIPTVLTCTGFELPPASDALPSIIPWQHVPAERLIAADQAVMHLMNGILRQYGKPLLARVGDLFAGETRLMTTFSELDHYGPRPEEHYVGPVAAMPKAKKHAWPAAPGKRIFAYLRPSIPGLEHLLAALKAPSANVLCVIPGVSAATADRYRAPGFTVLDQPISLQELLPEADLLVASGAGTVADALLAGVPLLMAPQFVEQALLARRIEALGAGVLWAPPRTVESARAIVDTALSSKALRASAQGFALKYRGYSMENAVAEIVRAIVTRAAD
ncbi:MULTISPECIES: glycosyltransferase [Ralstonia solanacearum species complex]|uniref:glycosyltransferase n=1 Tax=Ralstonia solanacearum species complex TaxID=3116862 RepID=UPI000E583565|nr:nucleotide disphospho-sugar-binding domain-containing protein [Ralstonia solanacearum]BEU71124.1 glycosyltransferase [Ralstonia pseudosolanacearum]AXV76115.1 UDP-glucuronosyltransferase [Ralstonia solanacearum]AXV90119.1 UDP-glucuronosyltransferase [Ralstonia solanacearum]AXW18312.1 UDP-glucuronosyltransferase [Ralstonia solanacearum]AXW75028.1 UDP-glucuronosyltransferase [Ralstonia solanacearum]